jgi:hypothetical protein
MPNAEHDTPTELGTLGRELSRVLEGIRANWGEGGSFAGALTGRADGLDDDRVRAFASAIAPGLRTTNDTAAELLALVERIGRGSQAITLRDLALAPPARIGPGRRAAIVALRSMAGAGGALYASAELGVIPHWAGVAGALLGLAAAGAMPGLGPLGRER